MDQNDKATAGGDRVRAQMMNSFLNAKTTSSTQVLTRDSLITMPSLQLPSRTDNPQASKISDKFPEGSPEAARWRKKIGESENVQHERAEP